MKAHDIGKAFMIAGVLFCSLLLFSSNAFAWGSITHALIDDNIGKESKMCNLNEIYGGMAVDISNLSPDVLEPESPIFYLYSKTHFDSKELWTAAQNQRISRLGRATAFGFVSHDNRIIGADYTAHVDDGKSPLKGYVIRKAEFLFPLLENGLVYGLGLSPETAFELCHILIEYAIDIMVVYNPEIGSNIVRKATSSAVFRSPEFPFLLVKAYARGLSKYAHISRFKAAQMIMSKEREFRKTIIVYGQALNQPDMNDAVSSVAMLLASLGQEIYGIVPGGELSEDDIINLARDGLYAAMSVCGSDYATAIRKTAEYVKRQMNAEGIIY